MESERRDEFSGWAGKLEEPGALSGVGLVDKEKLWGRLEEKMGVAGSGRGRRGVGIYWIAAACLVPLLVVAIYIIKIKARDKMEESPVVVTLVRPGDTGIPAEPVVRVNGGHKGIREKEIRLRAMPAQVPVFVVSDGGDVGRVAVKADTLVLSQVPVVAVKKSLRVVSINEISDSDGLSQPAELADRRSGGGRVRIGQGPNGQHHIASVRQTGAGSGLIVQLSSNYP